MNLDHLKNLQKLNTDFVVMQEEKNVQISKAKNDLEDIRNWLQQKEQKIFDKQTLEQELDGVRDLQ